MTAPPIRDVASSKHTKVGVYGASGIGKTRFVASSIEMGPTLILRPPLDQTESIFGSGCKEWVVQDWGEMSGDVLDYLRAEGNKWTWVWLDSLSLWDEMGLMDVWGAALDRKSSRREFGMDKQEYGINQTRLTEWLTHVVGLDTFHFGWTALPMMVTDPSTHEDIWMPMVQGREGKMTHKACGYMNVVGYLSGKKSERDGGKFRRTLYLQQDGEHYAKDQYTCTERGRLPEPTVPKLMAAIDAARKKVGSATPPKPARAKAARPATRSSRPAARRTTRKRES
jgi:hypothetical protein